MTFPRYSKTYSHGSVPTCPHCQQKHSTVYQARQCIREHRKEKDKQFKKEYNKEYNQRPEIKQYRKQYNKKYYQRKKKDAIKNSGRETDE